MKRKNELFIKIVLIVIGIGFIIGYFNNKYGASFLFGGALVSFLYEYFGLVKRKIKEVGK